MNGSVLKATATPLASIFGSGFLVIVPVLNGAVGPWAPVAMAFVCVLAYAVGSVIRFNIQRVEPQVEQGTAAPGILRGERTADVALVLAYAISVCLYVRILAAFVLGGFGMDTDWGEQLVAVAVILAIGVTGYVRGLEMLESLEQWALGLTMIIIVALLVGFGLYDYGKWQGTGLVYPDVPPNDVWTVLTQIGGTLIVVQGFETSRYLAEEYDTETRVSSCRLAQVVATFVYLLFVTLATPVMHVLPDAVADDGLLLIVKEVAPLLVVPLVAAAALSQFSAAVADTIGGGGNLQEATHDHIDSRHAYMGICGFAAMMAFFDTLQILALASRAFAFYYALQCLVAYQAADKTYERAGIAVLAVVLLFITFFAVPAG